MEEEKKEVLQKEDDIIREAKLKMELYLVTEPIIDIRAVSIEKKGDEEK